METAIRLSMIEMAVVTGSCDGGGLVRPQYDEEAFNSESAPAPGSLYLPRGGQSLFY